MRTLVKPEQIACTITKEQKTQPLDKQIYISLFLKKRELKIRKKHVLTEKGLQRQTVFHFCEFCRADAWHLHNILYAVKPVLISECNDPTGRSIPHPG